MTGNNGNAPQYTRAQLDAMDLLNQIPEFAEAHRAVMQRATSFPEEPPPAIRPDPVPPSLPEWATLAPNLEQGAGKWIDGYINYAQSVSPMTPRLFHESAALYLVSVAIARRLVLRMPYDDIYPNLFIAWLAPTTLYRKSTALNIARKITREVLGHLLAPQDTTPEAILSDMAGYQPQNLASLPLAEQQAWEKSRDFAAQKGLVYDEMSGLLAGAGKDYNAGLLEAFLRFYDNDPYYERSSRGQGRVVVKNAYLSILGAATPSSMAPHFKAERLWGLGWWPRFAILTPSGRPDWEEPREQPRPNEITSMLQALYNRLPAAKYPENPQPLTVTMGAGVMEAWSRYNRALSHELLTPDLNSWLYGTYGRLPTHALKVAMILAALDWQPGESAPHIELPHLARATAITETWRASAHRALEMTTTSETDRIRDRITRQLSKHDPQALSLRDLSKLLVDIDKPSLEMTLQDMTRLGEVIEVDAGTGAKGGRPTKRYLLSKE